MTKIFGIYIAVASLFLGFAATRITGDSFTGVLVTIGVSSLLSFFALHFGHLLRTLYLIELNKTNDGDLAKMMLEKSSMWW